MLKRLVYDRIDAALLIGAALCAAAMIVLFVDMLIAGPHARLW